MPNDLTAEERAFYSGVITCLAVLKLHDYETIFDEIVRSCDVKALVKCAKEEGELEFSGLVQYGWATKDGRVKRHV